MNLPASHTESRAWPKGIRGGEEYHTRFPRSAVRDGATNRDTGGRRSSVKVDETLEAE